ncbi:Integrator complex subunit 3 [Geranomyces michiganensis]|nr:Integrator complex subunit 3 [Geranomyces michiganensis]
MLDLVVLDDHHYVLSKLHNFLDDADLITCRPFRCGDLGAENLALARGVVNILRKHRTRITPGSELVPATVYSFLRLIADHQQEPKLRDLELDYVMYMLRNRFRECTRIGRDLLRVMQRILTIPQIKEILHDVHHWPQKLDASFHVTDLLATPSEPWLISQRITREMDMKLRFILDKCQTKNYMGKKALAKYRHVHLVHNGNESAHVDLIRFICTAIQPPNTILSSDIIQRWEVIMLLLSHIKDHRVRQDAKFALFFDWLHWNPNQDNIMYIEPAMLMMEKACQPGFEDTGLAGDTIEYLYLIVNNYMPEKTAELKRNVNFAMHSLVKLGVTRSLRKIYNAEVLVNGPGRDQLQSLFPQFVHLQDGQRPAIASLNAGGDPSSNGPAAATRADVNVQSAADALNASASIDALSIQQFVTSLVESTVETNDVIRRLFRGPHAEDLWSELIIQWNQQSTVQHKLLSLIAAACAGEPEIRASLCSHTLRHGLSSGVDDPKNFYRALGTEMSKSFLNHFFSDLNTLMYRDEGLFIREVIPRLCKVFVEATQDLRFFQMILSIMNFDFCAVLCDQLTQSECTIFDVAQISVLIEHSLTEFDEISIMFLWKLIVSQAGGVAETVDPIVQYIRPLNYTDSPATCEGLFQLLISAPPTPTTVAFAACLPHNRFAALTSIWRSKRCKPIMYTKALADALQHLSSNPVYHAELKALLDQLKRIQSQPGNKSTDGGSVKFKKASD